MGIERSAWSINAARRSNPVAPRERRDPARAGAVRAGCGGVAAGRREALARRGWTCVPVEGPADLPVLAGLDLDVLVLEAGGAPVSMLALGESYRAAGGRAEVVILLGPAPTEEQRRWAATFTPYFYELPLAEGTLAALLDRVTERRVAPQPADQGRESSARERTVTLRLWEAVEVDGREIHLGAAERNFLFGLASRPGQRIAKDEDVDVGAGRRLSAGECRKRLGRRLGLELTGLLIPALRGEPYRFREADEVAAVCRDFPERHGATALRVVGRGSVRAVGSARLEAFA